jgi:hypothetical protein
MCLPTDHLSCDVEALDLIGFWSFIQIPTRSHHSEGVLSTCTRLRRRRYLTSVMGETRAGFSAAQPILWYSSALSVKMA